MPSAHTLIIGYGSLMSAFGLAASAEPILPTTAFPVLLHEVRRGFGKPARRQPRLAMVCEPIALDRTLTATANVHARPPARDSIAALALSVGDYALGCVAEREGYPRDAVERIRHNANGDFALALLRLWNHEPVGCDAYRRRLFDVAGITSPHYIPHPVRFGDGRVGVIFLAPGNEGTGDPDTPSSRVRENHLALLGATDAYRAVPSSAQIEYFASCLLGEIHGLDLDDLWPKDPSCELAEGLHRALSIESALERQRFLAVTGLDPSHYAAIFAPSTHFEERLAALGNAAS